MRGAAMDCESTIKLIGRHRTDECRKNFNHSTYLWPFVALYEVSPPSVTDKGGLRRILSQAKDYLLICLLHVASACI